MTKSTELLVTIALDLLFICVADELGKTVSDDGTPIAFSHSRDLPIRWDDRSTVWESSDGLISISLSELREFVTSDGYVEWVSMTTLTQFGGMREIVDLWLAVRSELW